MHIWILIICIKFISPSILYKNVVKNYKILLQIIIAIFKFQIYFKNFSDLYQIKNYKIL